MTGTPGEWAQFGLAGLFAVFALLLLKIVFDYLNKERSVIVSNQMHIIETLGKINLGLDATTKALIDHDSRVSATMEIMAKFAGLEDTVNKPLHRKT